MKIICKSFDELTTRELYDIVRMRLQVFAVEQQIACQDLDNVDLRAWHLWIEENGAIAAYARIYEGEGGFTKIGRVLSATEYRGKGYGIAIMNESIRIAREKYGNAPILIHSQAYATGFYEKFGFRISSEMFFEEGIDHFEMQLP